ncbi:unnamed protein product [Calypogeia fissa]
MKVPAIGGPRATYTRTTQADDRSRPRARARERRGPGGAHEKYAGVVRLLAAAASLMWYDCACARARAGLAGWRAGARSSSFSSFVRSFALWFFSPSLPLCLLPNHSPSLPSGATFLPFPTASCLRPRRARAAPPLFLE